MRRVTVQIGALLLAVLTALPAAAVEPDEMLEDPVLEERARDISADLRCLVCRNESIDASNADFARDMRLVVRERLVAGDSNDEVKAFLVDRYGEYVLLTPRFSMANAFVWLAGPAMLVVGGIIAWLTMRRRAGARAVAPDAPLDAEETAALRRLLDGDADRSGPY